MKVEEKWEALKDTVEEEIKLIGESIKHSKKHNEYLSCLLLTEQLHTNEWIFTLMEEGEL